jgi:hypothetical protein
VKGQPWYIKQTSTEAKKNVGQGGIEAGMVEDREKEAAATNQAARYTFDLQPIVFIIQICFLQSCVLV